MGCAKVVLLCLMLCGTSIAEEKEESYANNVTKCLNSKEIEDRAANVKKCLADMIDIIVSNNTNLSCSKFSDFNQTFINFVNYTVKTCDNDTIINLSKAQNTFLSILKLITEEDLKVNIQHLDCIRNRTEELKQCYKFEERNYNSTAQRWLSRVYLNFDMPACPRTQESKKCTLNIIKKNCPPSLLILGRKMFDIALDNCDTKELNWQPTGAADIARYSYVSILTVVTALLLQ